MKSHSAFPSRSIAALLATAALATAQVPDGYVVFGTFLSGTGFQGVYFAHPRDTAATPIAVTNLPQDLSSAGTGSRGVAALARRKSDGAILAGERAPAGASVDLWVLRLNGANVTLAQSFSCGTSAGVGEIPQFGQLPDGRVVVAATDLAAGGQMAHFFNNGGYNWQGLSIVNTTSGAFTTVAVSNWGSFVGVMNGMAVSQDGNNIYLGAYISPTSGALWEIPVAGGAASLVANLPVGASNVTMDQDGTVLVTTLDGPPNLYRYDPVSTALTPLTTATGPLNAIGLESVTGNYMMATASGGVPPRSLMWRTPTGPENLLITPGLSTISALDINPNPESYGAGSPGAAGYAWQLSPNPGGLPQVGNAGFSLTVASDVPMQGIGVFAVATSAIAPLPVLGINLLVDPGSAITVGTTFADNAVLPLGIPATPSLVGAELFTQAILIEMPLGAFAASPGVSLTVL
jgi:hypothetical protein